MIARLDSVGGARLPYWRDRQAQSESKKCLRDTLVIGISLDTNVSGEQMTISSATFSSSQVAKAAGMTPINFRAHLSRGNWRIIGNSKAAEVFGKGHEFTLEDALGFALAHQLVSFGVAPKIAFERAMFDFAHTGSFTNSYGGDDRDPGNVFDPRTLGMTLYVYTPGAERGQCVASNKISTIELMTLPNQSSAPSAIVINLNALRDRVLRGLGLLED